MVGKLLRSDTLPSRWFDFLSSRKHTKLQSLEIKEDGRWGVDRYLARSSRSLCIIFHLCLPIFIIIVIFVGIIITITAIFSATVFKLMELTGNDHFLERILSVSRTAMVFPLLHFHCFCLCYIVSFSKSLTFISRFTDHPVERSASCRLATIRSLWVSWLYNLKSSVALRLSRR